MRRPTAALWLFLGYGVFVVYGSLVPLEYKAVPLGQAWEAFGHIPFLRLGLESRADWVANGVLYAPLAFFGARAGFERGLAHSLAVALAVVLCCALAVAVEFTQLFFPLRTVSQNDIMAECIGSVVGALAAPFLAGWIGRLAHAWAGGDKLGPRLLELYAVAYLLLCFFPYDLLLTADELRGKWQGPGWGGWIAPYERGLFFACLQLGVEVALALPLGALLVRRHPDGPTPWLRAAVVGALLGAFVEVGQFFVNSGVSQGASVASRVLGVMAGAAALPWLRKVGLSGLRATLRPLALPAWGLYLPLLVAVSGAFKHPWHGAAGAWQSWHGTRLLPFYYHYFTSESLAMFSLGSVALMYLPTAGLAWARGWSVATTLVCAALLSAAVEASKLFFDEIHADPTNVIVAVAINALALHFIGLLQRPSGLAAPVAPVRGMPATAGSAWLLALPAALLWAMWFPALPGALLALLLICAALVWRWPVLALALLPAAMPVLDFAPWSGRLYWDEFDLLCAVCLAVALHRTKASRRQLRPATLAFALLGLSLLASTLRALWPLPWPDDNSFSSYYSVYNALRIVKGALWAWLFVHLWQRLDGQGAARARLFSAGMVAGLALTVLIVLWERLVFAGLWDFAADFRVTGPFSAMHKGGAYIECFLAVASAFAVAAVLRARHAASRIAALMLLAGACYAMMVTYSRNGYAALAAVLLVSVLSMLSLPALRSARLRGPGLARQIGFAAVLVVVMVLVALPIAGGSYARERLARSGQDLAVRQAHWADGLAMRDDSLLTAVLGVGIGRFPETHYWRSQEAAHAASYRLAREGDTRYLRLGQGATLYLEQIIARPEIGALRLALDLRAVKGPASLGVMLCEKWTLSSRDCASVSAAAPAGAGWQHVELRLDASGLIAADSRWRAPLKLSLLTPATGAIDVTRVRLSTALGDELLVNGDFMQGMDHWFFATDIDPPWHLHSLPVAVLFDQGWFGVLVWAAVLLVSVGSGVLLLLRGQALQPAALAALAGFAVSASLNTLIDAPRFLWLLLVLLWLAAARKAQAPADPAAPALTAAT